MADILSQEEIDALLSATEGDPLFKALRPAKLPDKLFAQLFANLNELAQTGVPQAELEERATEAVREALTQHGVPSDDQERILADVVLIVSQRAESAASAGGSQGRQHGEAAHVP